MVFQQNFNRISFGFSTKPRMQDLHPMSGGFKASPKGWIPNDSHWISIRLPPDFHRIVDGFVQQNFHRISFGFSTKPRMQDLHPRSGGFKASPKGLISKDTVLKNKNSVLKNRTPC